ncbi:hypothetical protein, partial [Herbaspirillum sp. UBA812]|uniref:hypothetical protein n=1 Tax=Herbaspirillum sp. UBA812 TaxID=1946590 RepID=UPI00257D6492
HLTPIDEMGSTCPGRNELLQIHGRDASKSRLKLCDKGQNNLYEAQSHKKKAARPCGRTAINNALYRGLT